MKDVRELIDDLDPSELDELVEVLIDSQNLSPIKAMYKESITNMDRELADALCKIWESRNVLTMADRKQIYEMA